METTLSASRTEKTNRVERAYISEIEAFKHKLTNHMQQANDYLFSLQKPQGYWEGEVFDNVTITAEFIMFHRFLGNHEVEQEARAVDFILKSQLENGSWNLFYNGPGELNATVEAYQALKLAGLPKEHPALVKAREFIFANGGLSNIRIFSRIGLALFGQYPWKHVPVMPPELMFIPKQLPFNLWDFSSWSRSVIIPLFVILDKRPVVDPGEGRGIRELYDESPDEITYSFKMMDRGALLSTERFFILLNELLEDL